MDTGTAVFWLAILLLFVLVNGLFVATEYSLVRLRKSQVEEMLRAKVRGSATVKNLLDNMDRTVAGAQLGITIGGLLVGSVGQEPIRFFLQTALDWLTAHLPFLATASGQALVVPAAVALAASFVLLTIFHVIVGEQVPKLLALRNPARIALTLSIPFAFFCRLTTPILWVVNRSTLFILRILRLKADTADTQAASPAELQILIEESAKAGTLGRDESDILKRALELRGLAMKDLMVPLELIDCLDENTPLYQAVDIVSQNRHSRLPIFRGDREHIVGVLYTRELLDLLKRRLRREAREMLGQVAQSAQAINGSQSNQRVSPLDPIGKLSAFVRAPFFVRPDAPAAQVLEDLKERKLQMAVVADANGKAVGLVTQEDLLESLVGEIHDEYDRPIEGIEEIEGADDRNGNLTATYRVAGDITLFEFRKAFDVRLISERGQATVGDVVAEALGVALTVGDAVEILGYSFAIESLSPDGDAIASLIVKQLPPSFEEAPD